MNLKTIMLLFISFFSTVCIYCQLVSTKDPNQRLYMCMSNMPVNFSKSIKLNKIPNCLYFSNDDIDPKKTGCINQSNFKKVLDKRVPDINLQRDFNTEVGKRRF